MNEVALTGTVLAAGVQAGGKAIASGMRPYQYGRAGNFAELASQEGLHVLRLAVRSRRPMAQDGLSRAIRPASRAEMISSAESVFVRPDFGS